jgi:hypothetical protein
MFIIPVPLSVPALLIIPCKTAGAIPLKAFVTPLSLSPRNDAAFPTKSGVRRPVTESSKFIDIKVSFIK